MVLCYDNNVRSKVFYIDQNNQRGPQSDALDLVARAGGALLLGSVGPGLDHAGYKLHKGDGAVPDEREELHSKEAAVDEQEHQTQRVGAQHVQAGRRALRQQQHERNPQAVDHDKHNDGRVAQAPQAVLEPRRVVDRVMLRVQLGLRHLPKQKEKTIIGGGGDDDDKEAKKEKEEEEELA